MSQLRKAGRNTGEPDDVTNLPKAAAELLDEARNSSAGRAARTLLPGAHTPLKQTLLALTSGKSLSEHSTPTAAVLQVVVGSVRLVAGNEKRYLDAGDHTVIPQIRHSVDSIDDAVMLLTITQ